MFYNPTLLSEVGSSEFPCRDVRHCTRQIHNFLDRRKIDHNFVNFFFFLRKHNFVNLKKEVSSPELLLYSLLDLDSPILELERNFRKAS